MPIPPSVLPGGTGFGGGIFGVIPVVVPPSAPGQYNYGIIVAFTIYRGQVTPRPYSATLLSISSYRGAITNITHIEELGLNEF